MTAQVQDGAKWEASFRTHDDIFKKYGPVEFTVSGNDALAFLKTISEP